MTTPAVTYRDQVQDSDRETVRAIVASTGFFHDHEIDVAVELVDERLAKGLPSGYHFVFAEREGRVVGYTCYGPIACTEGSYDLYWIAVHNDFRGQGLGRLLMAQTEQRVAAAGGRRIYIETSNRPLYDPTRAFYLRCDYQIEAVLKDFYAPGDDKVILARAAAG